MAVPEAGMLQTEFEFTLPKGYLDTQGNLHRSGRMRLATAMDEIEPMRNPRVRENDAYLTIAILARVVTQLGELEEINTSTIERLFTADVAFLQDLYQRINEGDRSLLAVTCPECGHAFEVEPATSGEL